MRHVVVAGAGVFGVWTAHHLQAAGYRVTLVDPYGPASSRSSSGDETRIVRCGYGSDEIYTNLAARSLQLWREFARRHDTAAPLFHGCGVRWLAGADDPYTRATRETLERLGRPIRVVDGALLETDAGVVMARRSVQTLAGELASRGVPCVRARVVEPLEATPRLHQLRFADGERIAADLFVFACGAWLPFVLPSVMTGIIRPTRQVVAFFGTPPGDERFGASRMAAWIDFPGGIYGIPDVEGRGVKVGIDRHGPPFDPDTGERIADDESIALMRAWLARRLPGLAEAPVVESRVCQYENTSTGDFVIDRHPADDNVLIAGGGSGHGFKHGPAVGEYAARLLTTGEPTDARFSLAAKTRVSSRAVY